MLDLYAEFEGIIRSLARERIPYALCGGLALALYSTARATLDIDFLIPPASLTAIEKILVENGFSVRALPMEFHSGETVIHRFSKIDPVDGDLLSVDLLLVTSKNENAWKDLQQFRWNEQDLVAVSREGLILLKSLRNSDQDRADIRSLREV